ncbi:MAG TPA: DUF2505 domain-containing protein [Jatrophihabitans sp.]|nr:DUF2505 domain-containing protein [Jatrophihabitans sp.]
MKLSVRHSSQASVDQIYASHLEPGVREEACRRSGALSYQVQVRPAADGSAQVEVERVLPAAVPEFARKLVGERITVRQVENWSPADDRGVRRAEIRLTIPGQPASMVGTAELTPNGTGSRELITGDVKVAIPMLGRRFEPELVKVIEAGLRIEHRVAEEWVRSSQPSD